MKIQDFFQQAENLANNLAERTAIRKIENNILEAYNRQLGEVIHPDNWPDKWHKESIQRAKEIFDAQGLEYPEGD